MRCTTGASTCWACRIASSVTSQFPIPSPPCRCGMKIPAPCKGRVDRGTTLVAHAGPFGLRPPLVASRRQCAKPPCRSRDTTPSRSTGGRLTAFDWLLREDALAVSPIRSQPTRILCWAPGGRELSPSSLYCNVRYVVSAPGSIAQGLSAQMSGKEAPRVDGESTRLDGLSCRSLPAFATRLPLCPYLAKARCPAPSARRAGRQAGPEL